MKRKQVAAIYEYLLPMLSLCLPPANAGSIFYFGEGKEEKGERVPGRWCLECSPSPHLATY